VFCREFIQAFKRGKTFENQLIFDEVTVNDLGGPVFRGHGAEMWQTRESNLGYA